MQKDLLHFNTLSRRLNAPPMTDARTTYTGDRARRQMLAGGLAGCLGKTLTAPLSRLTILYQVSPLLSVSVPTTTVGPLHYPANLPLMSAMKRILQTEGFLSFWRGNLTSVLHRFPYSAINFTSYEFARDLLVDRLEFKESPEVRLFCGAIAGGVACFVCYPLDLARTRHTVTPGLTAATCVPFVRPGLGIYNTLAQVVKEEGFRGLYRGLLVSLAVSVPNLAIGFSVYGTMKERCIKSGLSSLAIPSGPASASSNGAKSLTPLGCMVSGACSGVLSSLIVFPADTVRRRLQVKGLVPIVHNGHGRGNGLIGAGGSFGETLRILRAEGLRGLYRGILPELLKVVPMVSVTFMTYELVLRRLNCL